MVDDKVYSMLRKNIKYCSWVLDIEEDINSALGVGPIKHLSNTGRLAHKISCARRYKTQRKNAKAFRRLLRLAEKECPLTFKKLIEDAKLDLA